MGNETDAFLEQLYWTAISRAVEQIRVKEATRVEGQGWKVYAVGSTIIRIDIND